MKKLEELIIDEDLINIANKAAQRFSDRLSQDEIKTCIMSAMWQASNRFDNKRNIKFSTYLYKSVLYECLKQKKIALKNNYNTYSNIENLKNLITKREISDFEKIDILDTIEKCKDPDIIYDKFYNNLSLGDIAKKTGVSKETVRFKLKKNLNFLKQRLS